jgi:hypothetical protein
MGIIAPPGRAEILTVFPPEEISSSPIPVRCTRRMSRLSSDISKPADLEAPLR